MPIVHDVRSAPYPKSPASRTSLAKKTSAVTEAVMKRSDANATAITIASSRSRNR